MSIKANHLEVKVIVLQILLNNMNIESIRFTKSSWMCTMLNRQVSMLLAKPRGVWSAIDGIPGASCIQKLVLHGTEAMKPLYARFMMRDERTAPADTPANLGNNFNAFPQLAAFLSSALHSNLSKLFVKKSIAGFGAKGKSLPNNK